MSKRLDFLAAVLALDGKPYLWGGRGPDGYDCSGVVTCGLAAVGILRCPVCAVPRPKESDFRGWHNAQRLSDELPCTGSPRPGDLAVYGRAANLVTHVMVCVGDGRVFGACGGGRETTTVELAQAKGARVRYRSKPDYRVDLLGFRILNPLDQE